MAEDSLRAPAAASRGGANALPPGGTLRSWLAHLESRNLLAIARPGVKLRFELAGIANRLEGDKAVFELDEGLHHDHLVCVRCGRVEEFVDAEIERRQRQIAADRGFELQEHALSLYGVCSRPECRGRSAGR